MPLSPYRPPGLNRDIWLPSDIDVSTRIVDHPRVRSYQKFTAQTKTTVHDTGNPNTSAEGEYQWLAGGRNGGSLGGYNAITDADQIIFTVPLDEITWHGGTPAGNQSWGVEMAYGGGQDFTRVLDVNAALHGALVAAKDWDPFDAAVLHQYWYGKWCSAQILNRNIWTQRKVAIAGYADSARVAAGKPIDVVPKYAKSVPIAALDAALAAAANPDNPALTVAPRSVLDPVSGVRFFWVGDRVKATQDTDRNQFAYDGSPDVGGVIRAGTEFDVNWLFIAADGKEWYLTPFNTRVLAEHTVRISDLKAGA